MIMFGTLGELVFATSSDKLFTFSDFSRKSSVNVKENQVIGKKPIPEVVNQNLHHISFSMSFNADRPDMRVNPMKEVNKLRAMMDSRRPYNLLIGPRPLGSYIITSINDVWKYIDADGHPHVIDVSVELKEYPMPPMPLSKRIAKRIAYRAVFEIFNR